MHNLNKYLAPCHLKENHSECMCVVGVAACVVFLKMFIYMAVLSFYFFCLEERADANALCYSTLQHYRL